MPTIKQEEKKKNGATGASVFPSPKAKEKIEIAAIRCHLKYSDMLDEIIERCGTTPRLLNEIITEIQTTL